MFNKAEYYLLESGKNHMLDVAERKNKENGKSVNRSPWIFNKEDSTPQTRGI